MSLAKTSQPLIGFTKVLAEAGPDRGDPATLDARAGDWFDSIEPANPVQGWFLEQAAITSMKIERTETLDEQLRNSVALKARLFWDDDRRLDAIQLGQRLADEPEAVLNQLRRTPQGCDWLIGRWEGLAKVLERQSMWSPDQRATAALLLGGPGDSKNQTLYDLDQRGMARRSIAELVERKAKIAGADALDRAMAEADLVDVSTPDARRLRRYEVTLHARLKWYLGQVANFAEKPTAPPVEAQPLEVAPVEPPIADEVEPEAEVEAEPGPEDPADPLEWRALRAKARRKAERQAERKKRA